MTPPIHSISDHVVATFPSGWGLGGVVIAVIATNTGNAYEVQFKDGTHNNFPESNVTWKVSPTEHSIACLANTL